MIFSSNQVEITWLQIVCLDFHCQAQSLVALTSALTAITETDFKAACASCPVQTRLRELLTSKWLKSPKGLVPNLQPFFKLQHELSLQGDLVVCGTHRLLVPDILQPKPISLAYDTHQGIVRTTHRLRSILVAKNGCPGWGSHKSMCYMPVTWQVRSNLQSSTSACAISRRGMGEVSYRCGRALWLGTHRLSFCNHTHQLLQQVVLFRRSHQELSFSVYLQFSAEKVSLRS